VTFQLKKPKYNCQTFLPLIIFEKQTCSVKVSTLKRTMFILQHSAAASVQFF
jgi:hypothetical protein